MVNGVRRLIDQLVRKNLVRLEAAVSRESEARHALERTIVNNTTEIEKVVRATLATTSSIDAQTQEPQGHEPHDLVSAATLAANAAAEAAKAATIAAAAAQAAMQAAAKEE